MAKPRTNPRLAKIHRNSGVLVHILNDLLDLSRIEAQRGKHLQRQIVMIVLQRTG